MQAIVLSTQIHQLFWTWNSNPLTLFLQRRRIWPLDTGYVTVVYCAASLKHKKRNIVGRKKNIEEFNIKYYYLLYSIPTYEKIGENSYNVQ